MKLVDATDLKSVEVIRVGSSPTGATNIRKLQMIEHYSNDLKKALKKWDGYIQKYDKRPTAFFKDKKNKWRNIVFNLWRKERPDLKALPKGK